MIAVTVAQEVRQLLCEGRWSQRKIARRLGISRGTVRSIALGRWNERPLRPEGSDAFRSPAGTFRRCGECGARVQMPCLACYVRGLRRNRGR